LEDGKKETTDAAAEKSRSGGEPERMWDGFDFGFGRALIYFNLLCRICWLQWVDSESNEEG
jgi:hypothetical protein